MKKKIIILAAAIPFLCSNIAYADETNNQTIAITTPPASIAQEVPPAATPPQNTGPVLNLPVVEDPKTKKTVGTKKIDLSAVIFDPKADFKAQAKEENREMTKTEEVEYNVHEALHCKVTSTDKLPANGLLDKYLQVNPKSGPFKTLNLTTGYQGGIESDWTGSDYTNTLYGIKTICPTLDGKFKDNKTSFRSMWLLTPTPTRTQTGFFNDVWGDQYIMYSWSKQDQFLLGHMRNASGIEGGQSPWTLPFANRSQIARTYGNIRSLQVKAQGQHKLYNYTAAVASAGRYFTDWFPGPEVIASFDIKPLGMTDGRYGQLLIGAGYDAGNSDSRFSIANTYIDYEYKRIRATIEYAVANNSNGSTGFKTTDSEGFVGTLAYRLTPKIELLGRYDQFDPNKAKNDDITREYTAGLNYFIKDQNLKLQLNYTVYSVEKGTYGSRIYAGTQILL